MPTYEYECEACAHAFEEFQSMSDAPLKKCPACGKKKLARVFGGGSAIIFKGSGFYETDYRSESYKAGAKAEQDASKPAGDSTSDKSGTTDTAKGSKAGTEAKTEVKGSTSSTKASDD